MDIDDFFNLGTDNDRDNASETSSSSIIMDDDDNDWNHHTMPSRTQDQTPYIYPLSWGGIGQAPMGVPRMQNTRTVGNDALRSISASISDDLSQKDKVEKRQLSALMRTPPPKGQDEALQQPKVPPMRPPGWQSGNPVLPMRPPPGFEMGKSVPPIKAGREETHRESRPSRRTTISKPFTRLSEDTINQSEIINDASQTQPRSRKRSFSEMAPSSEAIQEGLQELDVHELEDLIEQLGQRAKQLGSKRTPISQHFKYLTLYRIAETEESGIHFLQEFVTAEGKGPPSLYFDPPQWIGGRNEPGVLRSQLPVTNIDLYLEQNKEISFIVYKTYRMPQEVPKTQGQRGRHSVSRNLSDAIVDESIQPVNEALVQAIEALLKAEDGYASILESFEETSELKAPYLFVFHQRNEWERIRLSLPEPSHQQLAMVWDYIVQSQGAEYSAADSRISIGKITPELIKYLFKPGQLLVQSKDDEIQGWICTDWPRAARHAETAYICQDKTYGATMHEKTATHEVFNPKWELSVWHWEFDGEFQRKKATLSVSVEAGSLKKSGIPINTLDIYPLKYASQAIFNQIRSRGRNFWKCRKRALVSYGGDADTDDSNLIEERYMVDLNTYQILHKGDMWQRRNRQGTLGHILPKKVMENDNPPDETFEFLLPPKIKGFNLRTKKWYDLVADRISDVKWNKEAFSKVVIDRKAKDLIRALVSNQLESEKNTDLIEGKGNGLILLLHGGPGTGKTLTAESVAEIAEKPLYRVTCGDVGTKAEEVEKYLESVLYLGKLWGCVVLLDEADIFLQQRNLEDLQRNALVSVFLRVLEYYEGILVLTSNRVGTFDEAFKSRIQLALHYPALGPYQRLRITYPHRLPTGPPFRPPRFGCKHTIKTPSF